ncbi:MAG: hypothetical protein J7M15_04395 [Anaerolineae bacterium]|nr:hypothetical protein [Anaerolineae bacterium]
MTIAKVDAVARSEREKRVLGARIAGILAVEIGLYRPDGRNARSHTPQQWADQQRSQRQNDQCQGQ